MPSLGIGQFDKISVLLVDKTGQRMGHCFLCVRLLLEMFVLGPLAFVYLTVLICRSAKFPATVFPESSDTYKTDKQSIRKVTTQTKTRETGTSFMMQRSLSESCPDLRTVGEEFEGMESNEEHRQINNKPQRQVSLVTSPNVEISSREHLRQQSTCTHILRLKHTTDGTLSLQRHITINSGKTSKTSHVTTKTVQNQTCGDLTSPSQRKRRVGVILKAKRFNSCVCPPMEKQTAAMVKVRAVVNCIKTINEMSISERQFSVELKRKKIKEMRSTKTRISLKQRSFSEGNCENLTSESPRTFQRQRIVLVGIYSVLIFLFTLCFSTVLLVEQLDILASDGIDRSLISPLDALAVVSGYFTCVINAFNNLNIGRRLFHLLAKKTRKITPVNVN